MILGYKFWAAFRVVVLRRGFDARFAQLSRAAFQYNVSLGGGKHVLWCG